MSNTTSGPNGCPLCDKPVMGRTALVGHLEFGHDIADPEAYLAKIEQPTPTGRRSRVGGARRGARVLGVVVAVAALLAGAAFGYQEFLGADEAAVAADGTPDDGATSDTTVAPVTSTTVTSTTGATPQTTAPSTTTTAPSTTTTTTEPAEDVPFRSPFLLDARATGCTRQGDVDVHEFDFRFSGALNITFDGVFHPDDTGNGLRSSTLELPAGTSTYLDEVVVVDPSGGEHDVEISPPLYLGGC